jgi:GNAT superfamily N-acetyltransferase
VVRPAVLPDRAALLRLVTAASSRRDYLVSELEDWFSSPTARRLSRPAAEVFVAEVGRSVIGLARLTKDGPGQWWLDGVRVHPAARRRGVARTIIGHAKVRAGRDQHAAQAPATLRLCTDEHNIAMRRAALAAGCHPLGRYARFCATALSTANGATGFRQCGPADLATIAGFVRRPDAVRRHPPQVSSRPLRLRTLDGAVLAELVAAGQVFAWYEEREASVGPSGVVVHLGTTPAYPTGRRELTVGFVDAVDGRLGGLALALRGLVAHLEVPAASTMLAAVPAQLAAFRGAGWAPAATRSGAIVLGCSIGVTRSARADLLGAS